MAIRKIITLGDDRLRKVSREVTDFGPRTQQIIDDMIDTLDDCGNGIGLSAVQVGILRRIFIIDMKDGTGCRVFVNPRIVATEGSAVGEEGCLSIPGRSGYVERPQKVTVEAFDRHGQAFTLTKTGLYGVCICHEYDHLEGVLFIDREVDG
ncbi:MAG: peptide deformylase [Eubacteriales bacterium]|nr:peptide deformylase [Eubacteriales bacterium]